MNHHGVPFVEFHNNVVWQDAYQRNNKSNGQKNLRCFPNHCQGLGHQPGFCGHSIVVHFFHNPKSVRGKLYSFGEFTVADSELNSPALVGAGCTQTRRLAVGDTIPEQEVKDKIRLADQPLREYIEGFEFQERRPAENGGERVSFEFNRNLKGWHYGFHGSKLTRNVLHNFRAYVGELDESTGELRILALVSSPPWKLFCRRRTRPGSKKAGAKKGVADSEDEDDEFITVTPPPPPLLQSEMKQTMHRNAPPARQLKKRRETTPDNIMPDAPLHSFYGTLPTPRALGAKTMSPRRALSDEGMPYFGDSFYLPSTDNGNGLSGNNMKSYLRRLSSQKRLGETDRANETMKRVLSSGESTWYYDAIPGAPNGMLSVDNSRLSSNIQGNESERRRHQLLFNVLLMVDMPSQKRDAFVVKVKENIPMTQFTAELNSMLDYWMAVANKGPANRDSMKISTFSTGLQGFAEFLLLSRNFLSEISKFANSDVYAERQEDPYAVISFMMRLFKKELQVYLEENTNSNGNNTSEARSLAHTFSAISLKHISSPRDSILDHDLERFTQGLDALNDPNRKLWNANSKANMLGSPSNMKLNSFFGDSFIQHGSATPMKKQSSLFMMSFLDGKTKRQNSMDDLDDFLQKEGVTNVEELEVS